MAEGGRGLSIGYYALIMVALVLLAFLSYGAFTYSCLLYTSPSPRDS